MRTLGVRDSAGAVTQASTARSEAQASRRGKTGQQILKEKWEGEGLTGREGRESGCLC